MTERIAQVVVGLPLEGPFDYLIPEELIGKTIVGGRVFVSFGPRRLVGYVVGLKEKSTFARLKSLISLIDQIPILNEPLLQLTKEMAKYYGCSWGEAIEASLPSFLRKPKSVELSSPAVTKENAKKTSETILLHDPQGQERWPFIVEQIEKVLSLNERIIILASEISYVENIHAALKDKIKEEVYILDKSLSPKEELQRWVQAKEGKVNIILGTRSAIFAPLDNVGLILMFDEDNYAYKQEQSPYYHGRDVAVMRARIEKSLLVFISTTPSLEIYKQAKSKKIKFNFCNPTPKGSVQIVDMSHYPPKKSSILSFPLRSGIQKTLEANGKVVLFMNRKGFSTQTRCSKCGFTLKCKRCDVNLTYLYDQKKMVCRFCNFQAPTPSLCPKCSGAYLRFTGMGIEKLQSEISRFFPQARVSHFDKDSKTLKEGSNVIIATQAILRMVGKISPQLVGVVQADSELNRLDFRSGEKTFSLLVHLQNLAKEKLIIQTLLADNYCFKAIPKMEIKKFYNKELKLRQELGFPPFSHLVSVMLRGANREILLEQAQFFYKSLEENNKDKAIEIFDLQPDIIPKLRDKYRFTILLKGKLADNILSLIRKSLKNFKKKSGMIMAINVDT